MRFTLFNIVFLISIFIVSHASVAAKVEVPSIDEYKNVKIGILLEVVVEEEEENEFKGKGAFKKVVTIDDILRMYKKGKYKEALNHAKPLAENHQHQAEELLGIMYRMGQGVKKDQKAAYKWLSKAAEVKRPLSMHHIGVMHYVGDGVRQNIVRALMWLKLAQIYHPEGLSRDRVKKDYDNLISLTTRRDKTRSNELTKQWLESKGDVYLLEKK